MPEKQTREAIEAELNASESERIALQLQEVVREAELVEKDLRTLEDEHGIPEFARSPHPPSLRKRKDVTVEARLLNTAQGANSIF
jgi:hypothetical protein